MYAMKVAKCLTSRDLVGSRCEAAMLLSQMEENEEVMGGRSTTCC